MFDVTAFGADPSGAADATAAIRDALAAAAASAPAVVEFPAGTYRVDDRLRVESSGVVLRGAGPAATFLWFTATAGVDYAGHLTFAGRPTVAREVLLTQDAASRDVEVRVDPAGFSVGDEVQVGWTITDEFVADHGMTGTWTAFAGQWKAFYRRTVVAVGPASVTLDVPLRSPALVRDGASVRVVGGAITECGLESLAISNATRRSVAWDTSQVHAVIVQDARDCWVRDVASWANPDGGGDHLISSGIEVLDSRRITIADTHLSDAQHRGDGGNGYLFEISRSNEVLTRDCTAARGRHNFIQNWDFGTSGCVWTHVRTEGGRSFVAEWDPIGYPSYSEYHHSLATANLVEASELVDGWQGVNRQGESSGAGHSVTESVYWNLSGGGYLRSLQYGDGFVIGVDGLDLHVDPAEPDWNRSGEGTEPEDVVEGVGLATTLVPPSLWADQRLRRLGR